MTIAITLVSPDPAAAEEAARLVEGLMSIASRTLLGPGAIDLSLTTGDVAALRHQMDHHLANLPIDVCVQAQEGRRKRLLIADMDSTIIGCECLDELADFAGVKEAVSAITERAMRGELNFESALRERVGMLKGLPVGALQDCYDQRVRLNDGAKALIGTMTAAGAKCLLVSGGFTFFTSRVAKAAGQHPMPCRPMPCRPGGSIVLRQRRCLARDNNRVPTQSGVHVKGAVSIAVLRAGISSRKSGASCVRISTSMAAMSIVSDPTPSRVLDIYRRQIITPAEFLPR